MESQIQCLTIEYSRDNAVAYLICDEKIYNRKKGIWGAKQRFRSRGFERYARARDATLCGRDGRGSNINVNATVLYANWLIYIHMLLSVRIATR